MGLNRTQTQAGLFVLLLAADQVSKWWIEQHGVLHFSTISVIPGLFNIVRAHNTGVAFSMFSDLSGAWRSYLLLGVTIGIAFIVSIWWWREHRHAGVLPWALTLILSGAAGNIWDRFQQGYVVDFLDFYIKIQGHEHHWPAFNVADSGITIGVAILLISSFRRA